MKMQIELVSFSLARGGAAIAAKKFALLAKQFSDVHCLSVEPSPLECELHIQNPSRVEFFIHYIKRIVSHLLLKLMRDNNPVKHSLNLFSSSIVLANFKQMVGPNIVFNIHWFNNDSLSIWDLHKLPFGSVISLHDEWLYCGAEHYYPINTSDEKFITGYPYKDPNVRGVNWNSLLWNIKLKQLKNRDDLIFTVPSKWMFERASESTILNNKRIRLMPNSINTNEFTQLAIKDRNTMRTNLGFAEDDIVLTIGAINAEKNPVKGGELFKSALLILSKELDNTLLKKVKIIMFGSGEFSRFKLHTFDAVNMGRITTVAEMRNIYAIADCTVVPSLVESFGQVAAESLACQTPVVAFKTSGLLDIVQNKSSGYLAEPFDIESLADYLKQIISITKEQRSELGLFGKKHIQDNFSAPVVSLIYESILKEALRIKSSV